MKILIMDIIKPLSSDGSMIHRWELARNLAKLDCNVYVISYSKITQKGLHVSFPLSKKNSGYMVQLLKLITKYQFDIIYTRNIIKGVIGILIKKIWGPKLVFEINGILDDEQGLLQNQRSTKRNKRINFKMNIIKCLEIFVCKNADAIIAVTQGIKDYLINYGIDNKKIVVIENGANTELFRPIKDCSALKKRLHINNDESILIFVGNLAPWQGVEYLIQAAPQILKTCPNSRFLIIGDGIMKNDWMQLTKKLDVSEFFIFVGSIPYEQVPLYINASDVCIVTKKPLKSGYSPLKLYEYMACGKPVIATRTDGFEILEECNSGFLIDMGNTHQLADDAIKLLQNEDLRKQMCTNGREYVVKNHSWSSVAKKVAVVCEIIIAEHNIN